MMMHFMYLLSSKIRIHQIDLKGFEMVATKILEVGLIRGSLKIKIIQVLMQQVVVLIFSGLLPVHFSSKYLPITLSSLEYSKLLFLLI